MSDGLRTWVLSTLGGWLVALTLVFLGERGLLPPPPAAVGLRPPRDEQPRALAPHSAAEAVPGESLLPASATTSFPDEPPPPPRLLVAEPAGANLRAAPAMASSIVAVLPRGTLVEPEPSGGEEEAVDGGWRHVVWNGREGWVAESLLQPAAAGP